MHENGHFLVVVLTFTLCDRHITQPPLSSQRHCVKLKGSSSPLRADDSIQLHDPVIPGTRAIVSAYLRLCSRLSSEAFFDERRSELSSL